MQGSNKVFKVGFYANEGERCLNVMVEVFDDDSFYKQRVSKLLPDYMHDPIDYYHQNKLRPTVVKYSVGIFPILNDVFVDYSPLLFEQGDNLELRYSI